MPITCKEILRLQKTNGTRGSDSNTKMEKLWHCGLSNSLTLVMYTIIAEIVTIALNVEAEGFEKINKTDIEESWTIIVKNEHSTARRVYHNF